MKLFQSPNSGDNKIGTAVAQLKLQITNGGAQFANPAATKNMLSIESFGEGTDQLKQVHGQYEQVHAQVEGILKNVAGSTIRGVVDMSLEHFAQDPNTINDVNERARLLRDRRVSLEAATTAAMALGDPAAYATSALTNLSAKGGGSKSHRITVIDATGSGGKYGSIEGRDAGHPSLESFDERELKNALPYSVIFNAYAARQDEYSEAFFPTTVVTPDQAGIDVTVSRMLVFNEVIHSITGKKADFMKRNVIDAYSDPSILGDENTRLIPVLLEDGTNADVFVPSSVAGSYYLKLKGKLIQTAPLLFDQTVDILGLSNDQYLVGLSIIDNTDSMDARITLDNLYVQVTAGGKAIRFPTASFPRSGFVKSVEGNGREMNLQFTTTNLIVNALTTFADLSAVAAFPAEIKTGGYTARLSVTINGTANVEYGNIELMAGKVTVDSVQDANGNDVDLTAGAGLNIVTAFAAAKGAGYDLHAYRTNLNRRERGLLGDTTQETERYTIPLLSPISVPSPITASRDASDLQMLITICRVRNSNNAVTKQLNYLDQLRTFVQNSPRNNDTQAAVSGVQGMGRYLVKPYYKEVNLDLSLVIQSQTSAGRAADIKAAITNTTRSLSYDMYQKSHYQAAMDALEGQSGNTPTLLIGTDQKLVRHLMVDGDNRTFGTAFDKFRIVSTMDERMYGVIIGTFVREGVNGPDPLSFGTHAWIPELTSSVMVSRNNATVKEAMVQPRSLHICNLPVAFKINVFNLETALAERTATNMLSQVVTEFLDGTTPVNGNLVTPGTGGADGGTNPLDANGKEIGALTQAPSGD